MIILTKMSTIVLLEWWDDEKCSNVDKALGEKLLKCVLLGYVYHFDWFNLHIYLSVLIPVV